MTDPKVCQGKPVFTGTRVMVGQVLDMLASGEGVSGILRVFPMLKLEHISSALKYGRRIKA
ncbi:MAG: DUF433 domain-containing protein [Proteobacteria bacterium]|nr:DUF433 domain-containing protein [Pseudomonadota bacterium]